MKINNLKRKLFVSGVYVLLLTILLSCITVAKYQDKKVAYSSFGAASFNTVILNDENTEFGANLDMSNFYPGMKWVDNGDETSDTSQKLEFKIANGYPTEDNVGSDVSQATVEYTIKLRTLGTLPLKYTLLYMGNTESEQIEEEVPHEIDDVQQDDETYTKYEAKESEDLVTDENGASWHEYSFYIADNEENFNEAVFELAGLKWNANNYKFIIEWPTDENSDTEDSDENNPASGNTKAFNSTDYMKEVEMLQLVVTSSSKNMVGKYDEDSEITTDTYASGIIVIGGDNNLVSKDENGSKWTYDYTVDYRAFKKDDNNSNKYDYNFVIENGAGKQIEQQYARWKYLIKLRVPYNIDTQDFKYNLCNNDDEVLTLDKATYYLHNVVTKEDIEIISVGEDLLQEKNTSAKQNLIDEYNITAPIKVDSDARNYKLYKEYTIYRPSDADEDSNKPFVIINTGDSYTANNLQLSITSAKLSTMRTETNKDNYNDFIFNNKIQIIVEATGDNLDNQEQENGEATGEQE